jgi:hypothetical protein
VTWGLNQKMHFFYHFGPDFDGFFLPQAECAVIFLQVVGD